MDVNTIFSQVGDSAIGHVPDFEADPLLGMVAIYQFHARATAAPGQGAFGPAAWIRRRG